MLQPLSELELVPKGPYRRGDIVHVLWVVQNASDTPAGAVRSRLALPAGVRLVNEHEAEQNRNGWIVGESLAARACRHLEYLIAVDEDLVTPAPLACSTWSEQEDARLTLSTTLETRVPLLPPARMTASASLHERAPSKTGDRDDFSTSSVVLDDGVHARAGAQVVVAVHLRNTGTRASNTRELIVTLPHALHRISGTRRVDHEPYEPMSQSDAVGPIDAGKTRTIRFNALVLTPAVHGATHVISARFGDQELEGFTFAVHARPRFGDENAFAAHDADQPVLPGADVALHVRLRNTGTADAHGAILRFRSAHLRVKSIAPDGGPAMPLVHHSDERGPCVSVGLGRMAVGEATVYALAVLVPRHPNDNEPLAIEAALLCDELPEQIIGTVSLTPTLTEDLSLTIDLPDEALAPGQTASLALTIRNTGTADIVALHLLADIPAGIVVAQCHGLGVQPDTTRIVIPFIGRGATLTGHLDLRVTSAAAGKITRELGLAATSASGALWQSNLTALTTEAAPALRARASLTQLDDDQLAVVLELTNAGGAHAHTVRVTASELGAYVPGSTTLESHAVADVGTHSPLATELHLGSLAPHATRTVRYRLRLGELADAVTAAFRIQTENTPAITATSSPFYKRLAVELVEPLPPSPSASAALAPIVRSDEQSHETPHHAAGLPDREGARETPARELTHAIAGRNGQRPELRARHERAEPESETVPPAASTPTAGPLRFPGRQKLEGPNGVLRFDAKRRAKTTKTIDTLFRKDIGWYRHVFATRLFIPDRLIGVDARLEEAWETFRIATAEDFKKPYLRMTMNDFTPTLEWAELFGNPAGNSAMNIIMESMPEIIDLRKTYPAPPMDPEDIYGVIHEDNFAYFLGIREHATIHHVNALIPETIPTTSKRWPALSEALEAYRTETSKIFKSISITGDEQRHKAMTKHETSAMDEHLRRVQYVIDNELT